MNEFLRKFDTIKFVAPWNIFMKFLRIFIFFNLNLNLVWFGTSPNRNRNGPVWLVNPAVCQVPRHHPGPPPRHDIWARKKTYCNSTYVAERTGACRFEVMDWWCCSNVDRGRWLLWHAQRNAPVNMVALPPLFWQVDLGSVWIPTFFRSPYHIKRNFTIL